ncbi:MAG: NUDIX domain-containing protein [Dehalococcoidales bacterium]|nr:NUDIX domain-containing protein [Dehalococcoidales bacterium]
MSLEKYKILENKIKNRTSDNKILENKDFMVAAVSILIEKDNPDFPIYMIKRANEGRHALEWAFPGGKTEKIDKDLSDTASRETNEEIGVPLKDFTLWGELEPVTTLGTGWIIQPYVGEIKKNSFIKKNVEEVEDIAKIPLFKLIEKINNRYVSFTSNDKRIDSEAYAYEDKLIWGASARMIAQLSKILID